jgi:hypothetical protein
MKDSMPKLKRSALALSIVFSASSLLATTFVVPNDREMVRRTDAIVVATAGASYTQLNPLGGVETVTRFSVGEVIKGAIGAGTLEVHEPGGEYRGVRSMIPGSPRFESGQEHLLFLTRTPLATWAATDLVLGKFTFEQDRSGQKLAVRDEAEIVGWDSDLTVHVEKRRALDPFLDFVRAEAKGQPAAETYVVPYHPIVMKSEVQSFFTPEVNIAPYTATSYTSDLGGGRGGRWNVFPNGVNWYKGTTNEPGAPGGGVTAITTALASWDNDCLSNVNYVYAGVDDGTHTAGLSGVDGRNTILYERNLSSYGAPGFTCSGNSYSGTLGIGGITSATGTHTGPNGEQFFTIIEGDVEMNQGIANCTILFNNGDFNSAVTHELGHTLGLRHSDQTRANSSTLACTTDSSLECSTTAIMKSFISTGLNAALQAYDQHAVDAVYPGSCTVGAHVKGDFDFDGKADIFWHHYTNGQNMVWLMNGATVTSNLPSTTEPTLAWQPVGIGDFDNDGKADVFWRNMSTGQTRVWFMNGAAVTTSTASNTVADLTWDVVAVGDFSGDGKADVFWRNHSTGANALWIMNGAAVSSNNSLPTVSDTNWKVAGSGDFDGDHKYDIFWRNVSTGSDAVWYMNGATSTNNATNTVTDLTWNPVGVGDFDGDGKADILWRNANTGADAVWIMNGYIVASNATVTTASTDWQVQAVGDFSGDGKVDIAWRSATTGNDAMWIMNGSSITTNTLITAVPDLNWKMVGPK